VSIYPAESFQTKTRRSVTIRHCTAADIDSFMKFQPRIAEESNHTLQMVGRQPSRESLQRAWESAMLDPVSLRVAAFSGDQMIAQLSLYNESESPHPWTRHAASFGMMIVKEFWGEGIGRRLLDIMEAHARACGIIRIQALVRVENVRGLRLYTRMGYEIEGTRRQGALINGEPHDEYYIAKLLKQDSTWLPPVLETDRMILRPFTLEDAESLFEYANDPKVTEYVTWESHQSITDSRDYIFDIVQQNYRRRVPSPWAVTLKKDTQRVIGTVGCFWVSKNARSMELAYALGVNYWGQGLMTEASRAVMDYCFLEFDLNRIQSRCITENKGSARVMEKAGMSFEGTLREALFRRGRYWDLHHYAVLRNDWRKMRGNKNI